MPANTHSYATPFTSTTVGSPLFRPPETHPDCPLAYKCRPGLAFGPPSSSSSSSLQYDPFSSDIYGMGLILNCAAVFNTRLDGSPFMVLPPAAAAGYGLDPSKTFWCDHMRLHGRKMMEVGGPRWCAPCMAYSPPICRHATADCCHLPGVPSCIIL